METISWSRAATVPYVCHRMGARSGKDSRFLDNSRSTPSRCQFIYIEINILGSDGWIDSTEISKEIQINECKIDAVCNKKIELCQQIATN